MYSIQRMRWSSDGEGMAQQTGIKGGSEGIRLL